MASNSDGGAPPPRPVDRGLARRQAFLEAARQVFLQQGYKATSVNDVVRIAGGSLATLYLQFLNKEGLFLEVLLDQHARFSAAIAPESVDHLPLKEALCAIGERFLGALMEPENLAFFRLVIGEERYFPAEARKSVGVNADQVRQVVADVMRKHDVPLGDEEAHPSMLLELWRSRYHYRALADEDFRLPAQDLKRHVARCVDVLLDGVRASA